MRAGVEDACWAVFDTEDLKTPPGPRLVEIMDHRIGDLAGRYQGIYPAAAKILLTDREGLTAAPVPARPATPAPAALRRHHPA
jgi:putative transposase